MAGERHVPAGTYRGKLIKVSELMESKEKGTPFLNVEGEITEEGDYKGRRLIWTAFLTPNSSTAQRSLQALRGSGWNEELDGKWTGVGSVEQQFEIEQETYTPDPTAANPNPKTGTRSRIAWVNSGPRGLVGNAVGAEKSKSILSGLAGDLNRVKTGSVATEAAADGSRVDEEGNLVDKAGKKLY